VELTPSFGTDREELDRLRESGALAGVISLERTGQARVPLLVRPVIGDGLAAWMPELERELALVKGVVGISGTDMAEAAGVAAAAAAWLGDRGKTVILVDAAVECPTLGKALYGDRDEGLVDAVLFGVSRAAIVRRTLAPGVSVVTAGSHPLSVDRVFEVEEFSKTLRGLAEDALVFVLVPPAHVSKALGALDAAVCIAESGADVASLASFTGGVRTLGVLISETRAVGVEGEERDEPAERLATVPPTREEAARPVEAEESTLDSAQLDGQEDAAGPEQAEGPERRPVRTVGSSVRRRKSSDRLMTTVAMLVIVAIAALVWWFIDGERRFSSGGVGSVRTGHEAVVEDQDTELQENGPSATGDMIEAATKDESADRELAAADGEEPSGGGTTSAGQREAPVEKMSAGADSDDSAVRPAPRGLETDTVISGPGGPYRIMVSSHRYESAAAFEAGQLMEQGVATEVVTTEVEERGMWFRVVVSGGYPALSRAREILDTIKFLGYEGAWIERAPDNE